MSPLQLGRMSSAVAMIGMTGAGTQPLLLSSCSNLSAIGLRGATPMVTTAAAAAAAAATATATAGIARPYFLAGFGRNVLAGGLALTGHRAYSTLPEGMHDVGSLVSSATEKIGLGDNQFAAGGFQLALLGGILAGIRVLGAHAFEYLKKRVVVTAEFDSRDESYSWILNWLSDHPYSKTATQFSVSTTIARGAQRINGEGGDSAVSATYFLPAPGLHFFWFKKRLLWLYRERVRPNGSSVATSGAAVENISISTLGRSRDLIQSLIMEAQLKFIERDKSRTVIFQADQYGAWRRTKSRPKRPLDTIVMDVKLKNYIVDDARDFFASESWYAERGLPFRRGLLLYGSPGTGKTSFIHALAGELGLNIYVVNLSSKNLSDDTLSELVSDTPSRCLLLIEDVDAAFIQRESKDAATGITFSGLLNAIDGVSAQEGRMLCMTTNHLDRLDEALIRPGRVDVRARFGKATQSQAQELFVKFFPQPVSTEDHNPKLITATKKTEALDGGVSDSESLMSGSTDASSTSPPPSPKSAINLARQQTERLAAQFARAIPDQKFSIAQLQGFLMGYKKTPELAVEHVEEFVRLAGSVEVSGTAKIGYDENDNEGKDKEVQQDAQEDSEKQYYWEGGEEQQKERQRFRDEKESERRASLK